MFSSSKPKLSSPSQRRLVLKAGVSGALLCAVGAAPAWAQPVFISTAINRASYMEALSQRIVKAYAQLVLGVLPTRSQAIMADAQHLLKAALADLGRVKLPPHEAALLAQCIKDEERLSALLVPPPAAARLREINQVANQMLKSANNLKEALAGQSKAEILRLAGGQRMLSQRVAKSFMLIAAGDDAPPLHKELDASYKEFIRVLGVLETAPLSSPEIKQDLVLMRNQWMFFQDVLEGKDRDNALRDAATTSERILEVMEHLVGLYEGALKELLGSVVFNDTRYAALLQTMS